MTTYDSRAYIRIPEPLRIDPAIRRQMRAARDDFWRREMARSRRVFWKQTLTTIAFVVGVFGAAYLICGGRF